MKLSDLNKDMHLIDYISILQRRKWVAISFFLITLTTVAIATFMQNNIYRATATVIVDVESPDVLSVKDVIKLGETNYFAYRDYIETQQEIIRSRRTAYNVIKNLGLSNKEEFRKTKDPIETLLKKLRVELIRDTRILRINVDDEDPVLASKMANEFAKVYAGSNLALKMNVSSQAQSWLKEEVEKQKRKVTDAELRLQEYKEANNIVSVENQRNIMDDALTALNNSYLDIQRKRIQAETIYKNLLDKKENITLENLPPPLADSKPLQQLKDDHRKQETILAEYKKVYKHKHPKMIMLLENINYLNSRIKSEIESEYNNALNKVETEYNNALQEEGRFRHELDAQKKKTLELDRKIINYSALKREVETNERILQIVLNRLKETSISNQILTNNVRLQDLAEIPKKPIKPKKALNIALSIILGLIGGFGLVFFREHMDTTIKDPNEMAALLQIPLLGSVPRIRVDGKNIKKKIDVDRVVERDPHSLVAEAYRSIRTNLLFSINHSSSAKSIVIASSIPREGKTLTAVNLAMMISGGGERVLLVDADMRKPRMHMIFNDKNESGLSDFLLEKKDFSSIVKYSGIENLYIVTAGEIPAKPAELLSSKNMKLFIENASFQFSKIIFDTPPVALVTDAVLLSTICTGVLLVAEGGRLTKRILDNSKESLKKVDANILGIIVNNISLTKDVYSYPQHYYGKYYNTV